MAYFIFTLHSAGGLQTTMTDCPAVFMLMILMSLLSLLQTLALLQHHCDQWWHMAMHDCFSACLPRSCLVCLYSWPCSRASLIFRSFRPNTAQIKTGPVIVQWVGVDVDVCILLNNIPENNNIVQDKDLQRRNYCLRVTHSPFDVVRPSWVQVKKKSENNQS